MKIQLNKYDILVFLIVIVQIFYGFTSTISLIKIGLVLIAVTIAWGKLPLKIDGRSFFFIIYLVSLFFSSIVNLGNMGYSIKEFLVGVAILSIPIGLYFQLIRKGNTKALSLSYGIQKMITVAAIITLIFVFFTGDYVDYDGLGIRLTGVGISPSVIALNANLVLIFCLLTFIEKKQKLLILPILFAMAMTFLAVSKSGIAMAIISFVYVAIIKKKYIQIAVIFVLIIVVLFFFTSFLDTFTIFSAYVEDGSIERLSGRDNIWEVCKKLIASSPFLGYGYNSVVVVLPASMKLFLVEQAHSAYYESLINVGMFGSLLLGIYIIKVLIKCIINFTTIRNNIVLAYFFFLLIMGLIRGFTEASFAQANNIVDIFIFYISLFLLDYFCTSRTKNR